MAYHENSRKTFIAASPIPQDSLVKLTVSGVEACGAGEQPVGVTETGAKQTGDHVAVRLLNTPGTLEAVSGGVVASGQSLTSGASGSVITHSTGAPLVGMALTASTSGGLVEFMPVFLPMPVIVNSPAEGA